tara:strand:- start:1766 stop:2617 length:852 start_codon:yes stop_codon:yes gene_type:complete
MKFANFLILPLIFLFTYCSKSDSNDDNQIDDNSSSSVSEVRDSTEDSSSNSQETSESTSDNNSNVVEEGVPEVFKKIYAASRVYLEGNNVVIEVDGAPDHKSPYYSRNHELYEPYNGSNTNFNQNPNSIKAFDFKFKIPLNPKEASNKVTTQLGSIGVSLNGVAFYNQYAGPNNQPLTNEINSFDQYAGHPQNQGVYHYHLEPTYLTSNKGQDALLGFLLDGFPVYGPFENDVKITNENLDEYHGHSHITPDYPNGIYHYHITDTDPYINGNGYYGSPGTVSQ